MSIMSGREIITLQIGHYSNFVGAHWWNLQESCFVYDPEVIKDGNCVNHDILFREGTTTKGIVTFTPRLVSIDLKGSLNTLSKHGGLYDDGGEEEVKWPEDVTLHEAATGLKNEYLTDLEMECEPSTSKRKFESSKEEEEDGEIVSEVKKLINNDIFGPKFYDLDDGVKVWSDYLKTYLHPKSLHIVNDYMHADTVRPFNVFGMGQDIFSNSDSFEIVEERIRFFVEDCDQLQGFHCLVDTCDGFGGSASCCLQYLEDEFTSKSRITFGVAPPVLPDSTAIERSNRIINSALCYENMSDFSSLFVPLSLATSLWTKMGVPRQFPNLQYKPELHYHTSSILATTIDTMTMPYRREDCFGHMSDVTGSFGIVGRKIAALNTSFPYIMMEENGNFVDSLMLFGNDAPWQSLVPHVKTSLKPDVQSCVARGIPEDRVKSVNPSSLSHGILASCSSAEDILQQYLTDVYSNTKNAGCVMKEACRVTAPFPHIFSSNINKSGYLAKNQRLSGRGVESVPMMTSLQSCKEISNLLSSLHTETSRFNIRKHHRFLESGLDEDGFTSVLDNLQTMSSCYEDM